LGVDREDVFDRLDMEVESRSGLSNTPRGIKPSIFLQLAMRGGGAWVHFHPCATAIAKKSSPGRTE